MKLDQSSFPCQGQVCVRVLCQCKDRKQSHFQFWTESFYSGQQPQSDLSGLDMGLPLRLASNAHGSMGNDLVTLLTFRHVVETKVRSFNSILASHTHTRSGWHSMFWKIFSISSHPNALEKHSNLRGKLNAAPLELRVASRPQSR